MKIPKKHRGPHKIPSGPHAVRVFETPGLEQNNPQNVECLRFYLILACLFSLGVSISG